MKETANEEIDSPRFKHYILMPQVQDKQKRIPIPNQVIQDYLDGLTPFQRESLKCLAGGEWGCLGDGKPVFYIKRKGEVAFFGHCQIFVSLFG